MGKLIKRWNVFITTPEQYENGNGHQLIGCQSSPNYEVVAGFLMFTSLDGFNSGLNLREVMSFTIEPQYAEEK